MTTVVSGKGPSALPAAGTEADHGPMRMDVQELNMLSPAECERLLVERGVRLAESLFPHAPRYAGASWTATGGVPALPREPIVRPAAEDYAPPPTAPPPG